MGYAYQIESRPGGKVSVVAQCDADYPDADLNAMNRASQLHREVLADVAQAWTVFDGAGDDDQ